MSPYVGGKRAGQGLAAWPVSVSGRKPVSGLSRSVSGLFSGLSEAVGQGANGWFPCAG